jgi:hypothetical protein
VAHVPVTASKRITHGLFSYHHAESATFPMRPAALQRSFMFRRLSVPRRGSTCQRHADQTVHAPLLGNSRIMPRLAGDAESQTGTTLSLEAERAALLAEQRILLQEQAILQRIPVWNTKAPRLFLEHLTEYEKRFRAFLRKLEPPR